MLDILFCVGFQPIRQHLIFPTKATMVFVEDEFYEIIHMFEAKPKKELVFASSIHLLPVFVDSLCA